MLHQCWRNFLVSFLRFLSCLCSRAVGDGLILTPTGRKESHLFSQNIFESSLCCELFTRKKRKKKKELEIQIVSQFNVKLYCSFVGHKWFHLLQNLLALLNDFILFTGTSWVLCVPWSCQGPSCAVGDLTHISRSLISHKHTLVLNYPSLEHIVNLSYMWQTQHHSDPQPPSVTRTCICFCDLCALVMCVSVWEMWVLCMYMWASVCVCVGESERGAQQLLCLIKSRS